MHSYIKLPKGESSEPIRSKTISVRLKWTTNKVNDRGGPRTTPPSLDLPQIICVAKCVWVSWSQTKISNGYLISISISITGLGQKRSNQEDIFWKPKLSWSIDCCVFLPANRCFASSLLINIFTSFQSKKLKIYLSFII